MGRLFDNPMVLILILVVILLLFGAPKLPGMARSLGQSMRIFKSEVREMKDDKDKTVVDGETTHPTTTGTSGGSTSTAPEPGTARAADADPVARQDSDGTAR